MIKIRYCNLQPVTLQTQRVRLLPEKVILIMHDFQAFAADVVGICIFLVYEAV